jgi:hypothetical protein
MALISMARNCRQTKNLHSTSYVKIKDSLVRNAERGIRSPEGRKQKAECGVRRLAAVEDATSGARSKLSQSGIAVE